jgi:hypothetical protein
MQLVPILSFKKLSIQKIVLARNVELVHDSGALVDPNCILCRKSALDSSHLWTLIWYERCHNFSRRLATREKRQTARTEVWRYWGGGARLRSRTSLEGCTRGDRTPSQNREKWLNKASSIDPNYSWLLMVGCAYGVTRWWVALQLGNRYLSRWSVWQVNQWCCLGFFLGFKSLFCASVSLSV